MRTRKLVGFFRVNNNYCHKRCCQVCPEQDLKDPPDSVEYLKDSNFVGIVEGSLVKHFKLFCVFSLNLPFSGFDHKWAEKQQRSPD